ncbi:MAG: DUF2069 domain-containing protein [Betaproteobacteria bacterium]
MESGPVREVYAPIAPAGSTEARIPLLAVLTLIGVLMLWELWLAPIRPGGSWLALKVLPLVLAVPGLLRGRTYTWQWLSLALPFYVAEGIVRGWSEAGRVRLLAETEVLLAGVAFVAILVAMRRRRLASPSRG